MDESIGMDMRLFIFGSMFMCNIHKFTLAIIYKYSQPVSHPMIFATTCILYTYLLLRTQLTTIYLSLFIFNLYRNENEL